MDIIDRIRCIRCKQHVYIDDEKWIPAIIAADEDGFRIIDTLIYDERKDGERIYLNAGYKTIKCKYCGKEETLWISDIGKKLPIIKEDGTVIP